MGSVHHLTDAAAQVTDNYEFDAHTLREALSSRHEERCPPRGAAMATRHLAAAGCARSHKVCSPLAALDDMARDDIHCGRKDPILARRKALHASAQPFRRQYCARTAAMNDDVEAGTQRPNCCLPCGSSR